MKLKSFSHLLVLAIVNQLFAQPVLNSANINYSTTVNRYSANPLSFNIGANGINNIWDYSTILLTSTGTSTSTVVSTAPFINNFTDTNYIIKSTSANNDRYTFAKLSATKFEILGITTNSSEIVNFSQNPQTLFEFPYTYNLIINDNYSITNDPTINNSFSILYDASGILTTPFGTYNIFRTKKLDGIYPEYNYYRENTNLVLLNIFFGANGVASVTFYEHTSLHSADFTDNNLNIYPNPTSDWLIIRNDLNQTDNFQYKILDLNGRIISCDSGKFSTRINLENLITGSYIIQMTMNTGKTLTSKFIKI